MTTYAGVGLAGGLVDGGPAVLGDPDALEQLARRFRRTADALRADVDLLRGTLLLDGWEGPAARSCADATRHVPRDLARAATSFVAVASALADYADALRVAQARGGAAAADVAFLRERLSVGPFEPVPLTVDEAMLAQARRREALQQELALTGARLAAARDEADQAARRAAARVAAACDAPYDRPGLLPRAVDSVGDWVDEHATTIASVADLLGTVAGLAAMLSVAPGLTWLAGVAAVAGALSVGLQALLAMRGKTRWEPVLLGVVSQGAPAARAVSNRLSAAPAARPPVARPPVVTSPPATRERRRREQFDGFERDRAHNPCS